MLKMIGDLPTENIGLALSGGIDSMTVAKFLLEGRKDFTAFHFDHGTEHGAEAEKFVYNWCREHDVPLIQESLTANHEKTFEAAKCSRQEFYRNMRYRFFNSFPKHNIIMAHHLDDVLETWLFSTLHGQGKVIPYRRNHIIRPFLKTTREDIVDYAKRHGVQWIDDPSNDETDYMRNYIRHELVPRVEHINPGIRKMIARKIQVRG